MTLIKSLTLVLFISLSSMAATFSFVEGGVSFIIDTYGNWNYSFPQNGRVYKSPMNGRVERIGNVSIRYNPMNGNVERIGDVRIRYSPMNSKVEQIGGMRIYYGVLNGVVERTSGYIN